MISVGRVRFWLVVVGGWFWLALLVWLAWAFLVFLGGKYFLSCGILGFEFFGKTSNRRECILIRVFYVSVSAVLLDVILVSHLSLSVELDCGDFNDFEVLVRDSRCLKERNSTDPITWYGWLKWFVGFR